jgi:hypothetical protein
MACEVEEVEARHHRVQLDNTQGTTPIPQCTVYAPCVTGYMVLQVLYSQLAPARIIHTSLCILLIGVCVFKS